MSPEYLEQLADIADPDKLWQYSPLLRTSLSDAQRHQLDTGVALRRYATHMRDVQSLLGTDQSWLITPLSPSGSAKKAIKTPPDHAKLRRQSQ